MNKKDVEIEGIYLQSARLSMIEIANDLSENMHGNPTLKTPEIIGIYLSITKQIEKFDELIKLNNER